MIEEVEHRASATTVIHASPEAIFAVLADQAKHAAVELVAE